MSKAPRTSVRASGARARHRGADWIILSAIIITAGLMMMSVAADGAERLETTPTPQIQADGIGL